MRERKTKRITYMELAQYYGIDRHKAAEMVRTIDLTSVGGVIKAVLLMNCEMVFNRIEVV